MRRLTSGKSNPERSWDGAANWNAKPQQQAKCEIPFQRRRENTLLVKPITIEDQLEPFGY